MKQEIKIYKIRDKYVMLDSDLASIYNLKNKTKELNQIVKRNISKFLIQDYFRLSKNEYLMILRSQNVTLELEQGKFSKYLPYVFTIEGIEVLNNILRKEKKDLIFAKIKKEFELQNNSNLALSPVNTGRIEDLIYEIRGKQVMLDSDLARLYECTNGTKEINQAVKNNRDKFPERFAFRISENEFDALKSKFLTSKGGSRKGHTVFTEQGVAMLATVLKSDVATKVSIAIMDAFVLMRKFISNDLLELNFLKRQILNNSKDIDKNSEDIKLIQETLNNFQKKEIVNSIFFNGQIYDAYSKLLDIMSEAKKKLIIIDGYADKSTLDMISKLNVEVILITKNNHLLKKIDFEKYNAEYHNLTVIYNNTFHDRYLIIDEETIYHCGTSLNHAGEKTFSINKLTDTKIINLLLKEINTLNNQNGEI